MPNPPTYPSIADLERLASDLALCQTPENEGNLADVSLMPNKRIRRSFQIQLDTSRGGELALCQYLDILKANRKLKPFLELALRYAIIDYSIRKHHNNGEPIVPFEYLDDIQADIEWLLDNLDWSKE